MTSSTKKDILDAAVSEFALRGFAGASTLEIAKAAATKQPLLYYHFKSKEKLWQAAVDFGLVELHIAFDTVRDASTDMSPINVLKLLVRTLNRFSFRHPRHIDILRQEQGSDTGQSRYLIEHHLLPAYEVISSVAKEAEAQGQIRPCRHEFLGAFIFGTVTNFFSTQSVSESIYSVDFNVPGLCEQHADWLVEVIFGGLEQGIESQKLD